METTEVLGAIALGLAAGLASGLLGIGGGLLFVPGLVLFLEQSQVEAQATSLLAMIPVALVGVWRQTGYGNVRLREGLLIGVLSPLGVVAGSALANEVSGRALQLLFAAVQLVFAYRLARRAIEGEPRGPGTA